MRDLLIKACLSMTPPAVARVLAGDFVPVFMMHRVVDAHGECDHAQLKLLCAYLEYLRRHQYLPVRLQDLLLRMSSGEPLPRKAVIFTVDDGFSDQFEYLGPVFARYDVPVTCFVITDFLDGRLWPWDDQVKYIFRQTSANGFTVRLPDETVFQADVSSNGCRLSERRRLVAMLKLQDHANIYNWLEELYKAAEVDVPDVVPDEFAPASWEQARKFVQSGHDVAAHTRTHRILSRLNDAEASEEIIGSYGVLKQRLPDCADTFAYPTGLPADFGPREMDIIRRSPLLGAVSTVSDAARPGYPSEAVPRFSLPGNMCDFLQTLSYIEVLKNRVRGIGPLSQ